MLYLWLLFVFLLGAAVGSFLNVCIYRLPLDKSILWPTSRCGRCLQPIRWYDNIPLLSYLWLLGRCRICGARYSFRYFLIELLTALGFVGLFYLEVMRNVHQLNLETLGSHRYDSPLFITLGPTRADGAVLAVFGYHAVLFSFLMAAAFCDFDHQVIPLPLTITGTLIGLIGALCWPWPWPYNPLAEVKIAPNHWSFPRLGPKQGLQLWPAWGPLPGWMHPGGNWQTGLATSLAGLLVGTLMLRAVRLFFGIGMGPEYMEEADPLKSAGGPIRRFWSWLQRVGGKTLGLGDADLMMMAGAFIGWQAVVVAFFVSVLPGMFFGLVQIASRGERQLPFGPSLAIGIIITTLYWHWLSQPFQPVFFHKDLLVFLAVVSCIFMLLAGFVLRFLRWMRR